VKRHPAADQETEMATKKSTKTKTAAKKRAVKKAAPKKAAAKKAATGAEPKASTKSAQLLELLSGEGTSVEAMCKALGWQAHTLRAALTRLPGGAKVERTRVEGVTSYRLA
jgi:hypothetical protein